MYECSPKPNRTPGLALGLIFFVSAVVLILPFHADRTVASLLFGIGLLFLMASCSVIERFVLTDYIYGIERTDSGVDFTVTAVRFKKNLTVCRISVYQISEVMLTRKHISQKKIKHYNYSPDLLAKNRCFMRISGDEEAIIKFSPDSTMIKILNGYITKKQ